MNINFWKSSRGDNPVEDFILSIRDAHTKSYIYKQLQFLEHMGTRLLGTSPRVKPLQGYNNLYEYRIRYQKNAFRFFFTISKGEILMLHAFNKKDENTPKNEIEKANSRKCNLKD